MKKVLEFVKHYFSGLDKILILICIMCSTISMLCLISAYYTGQIKIRAVIIQGVGIILGIILASVISMFDYETLAKLWKIHLPATLLLVLLTFTPLGVQATTLADDKAWLNIGITTIQPSELLKISFVLTFALHLSKVGEKINTLKGFLLLCAHAAIPIGLIALQGDFGSALVFVAIFIMMMFVAGLSVKLILVGLIGLVVAVPLLWKFVLPDYLKTRFFVAWHPENYRLSTGMQQYNGRLALGSGGLFGKGLFSDNLYTNVPEAHNDFIFSYIGQTLGFIGCAITLLLIVILCVKMLVTARGSRDVLGNFICIGMFAIFFFQTLINIGMVLCITPVIGITLPFFSAGGTSVAVSYIAIGVVLSVYRNSKKDSIFD